MNQRMQLLSEEIARAKYGRDQLLTDFEFNSLNESFQNKEEKKMYTRYKEADAVAERALVNLQGLSFNIRLNISNVNTYAALSFNIGQTENIVNAILSNIDDKVNRKKLADKSIDACKIAFSDNSVGKDGFVNLKMDSANNELNLEKMIKSSNESLHKNLSRFKSWESALIDYFQSKNVEIRTYSEILHSIVDSIVSASSDSLFDHIDINTDDYEWFLKYVLVE